MSKYGDLCVRVCATARLSRLEGLPRTLPRAFSHHHPPSPLRRRFPLPRLHFYLYAHSARRAAHLFSPAKGGSEYLPPFSPAPFLRNLSSPLVSSSPAFSPHALLFPPKSACSVLHALTNIPCHDSNLQFLSCRPDATTGALPPESGRHASTARSRRYQP